MRIFAVREKIPRKYAWRSKLVSKATTRGWVQGAGGGHARLASEVELG